ncbi:hypothetical protein PHPALM_31061 [Phytophthora palmivora]|uniref:Uncharacterized protein n=1 Tax=Phytophthora palmivora TaxID=4796 RepID=A0A2P4X3K0_9STRA|nr:hypothetical protein PHPALM_31061 [Phytophthora palmivora]
MSESEATSSQTERGCGEQEKLPRSRSEPGTWKFMDDSSIDLRVDDVENEGPRHFSSATWAAPCEHDRHLSHAMRAVRRVCSEIGFVPQVSIASLDDDLLRLRSCSVDDLSLTRTRNPAKGFGPVQHGIVSLTTGLFLCGHLASKGESVVDMVKVLQRSLCGVVPDRQIHLPSIMFALDRGYQSKEVNLQFINSGGSIIGTHKRKSSFPFTYGNSEGQGQKVVDEDGPMFAQWAMSNKTAVSGTTTVVMQALAYKSGLEGVALCTTSVKALGPGKWSYIPETECSSKPDTAVSDAFQALKNAFRF